MKISIITVAYNSAATIKDTFDSILRQSYQNYEYIVIDGLSKDATVDIIKEYEPEFAGKMHWISEKDSGLYDAMNKGIKMASGDVVGILNSDDFFTDENVLDSVNSCFEQNQPDAVYGDVCYVKADNVEILDRYYSSKKFKRWKMRIGLIPAIPANDLYKNIGSFEIPLNTSQKKIFEKRARKLGINQYAELGNRLLPANWWIDINSRHKANPPDIRLSDKNPLAGKYSLYINAPGHMLGIISRYVFQSSRVSCWVRPEGNSPLNFQIFVRNNNFKLNKYRNLKRSDFRLNPGKVYKIQFDVDLKDLPQGQKNFSPFFYFKGCATVDQISIVPLPGKKKL